MAKTKSKKKEKKESKQNRKDTVKSQLGRPTKLTPERADRIIKLILAGCYVDVACQAVGVDDKTYYKWLQKGRQGIKPYSDFLERLKQAEAEAEARQVEAILLEAEKGTWQARAWWLERKYPERWARKERLSLEHTGKDGGPIQIEDIRGELARRIAGIASRLQEEQNHQEPEQ